MSIAQRQFTAAEYAQMTFARPTELVAGELAEQPMPTIQHGAVCAAITMLLGYWARMGRHGAVMSNDSFVMTDRNPDTVRGPDCLFISAAKLPNGKLPAEGILTFPADLTIEVLSPSDRWTEVLDKVLEYLRSGVTEVWVIDPEQRSVTIHRPDVAALHFDGDDLLTRPEFLPGFECRVSDLFADLPTQ